MIGHISEIWGVDFELDVNFLSRGTLARRNVYVLG